MDQDAKEGKPVDASDRKAYQAASTRSRSYQRLVRGIGYVRDGLSLGSILVLMALGLSIMFGVMGVINMAHGELMMIGAFATYHDGAQRLSRFLPTVDVQLVSSWRRCRRLSWRPRFAAI